MSGAENCHFAPIVLRTGFPMFKEFVNPLMTMNDLKDKSIQ